MIRSSCLLRRLIPPLKQTLRRSFKRQSIEGKVEIDNGYLKVTDLWKPVLYSAAFTGTVFAGCSIWQYENYVKTHSFVNINSFRDSFYRLNQPMKRGHYRNEAEKWWKEQSDSQKLVIAIAFINALVFIGWKVPSMRSYMNKYFTCSAVKKPYAPMFLSMFSHSTPVHLGLNMFVLYSFSQPAGITFGKEQFLALFLAAGMCGSLASVVNKTIVKSTASSLGASGGVFGPLAATCILYPDSQLQIVFLPFFTFSAGMAIKCMMAVDLIGMFARWRFLDHAAHLGGALFGVYYVKYGQYHFSSFKSMVIKEWHEMKTGKRSGS